MRRVANRLAQSILVLLVMSFVVYGLIGLMPGDPLDLMAAGSPSMTQDDLQRLKALYGVDQPLLVRYGHWLAMMAHGDLGFSRMTAQPVAAALGGPLAHTAALMIAGLAAALLIGLPAGIAAALAERRPLDHALSIAAIAALSVPVFWLGLLLIVVFAVDLQWLPASGVATAGDGGAVDRLRHLALPVAALGVAGAGLYQRYMRSAMIDTLRADWIRTARAKGLSWRRVVLGHALRSALIPVVTVLALDLGTLFSGVLVTETVFAYPGMGKLIFDAVMGADYNLAMAGLLLATALTLTGNVLADIAYTLLDPRTKAR
jgi:peptide/nickel transport system permease protein